MNGLITVELYTLMGELYMNYISVNVIEEKEIKTLFTQFYHTLSRSLYSPLRGKKLNKKTPKNVIWKYNLHVKFS